MDHKRNVLTARQQFYLLNGLSCLLILSTQSACAAPATGAAEIEVYSKLAAQAKKEKWNDKFLLYEKALLGLIRTVPQSNRSKEAEVYCDLGNFYFDNKKYQLAAENLELCLKIVKPMCSENSVTLIGLQSRLTEAYKKSGDKSKADFSSIQAEKFASTLMEEVQKRIKSAWHPPKSNSSQSAVGRFKVDGTGDFVDIRLSKSSGIDAFDQVCLEAMKNANGKPMQSWPYYIKQLDVEFKFDYNVRGGVRSSTIGLLDSGHANLDVLQNVNKINSEINKQLTEFIAVDSDKTTVNTRTALLAVALSEHYLNIGQLDKADKFINDLLQRPVLNQSESVSKIMLQAETACILMKQQKVIEAAAILKTCTESPFFEQISSSGERQRFLKSYGDALFKQGKETEANTIYARSLAVGK